MPTRFRILLIPKNGGPEEECKGEISDADWALLIKFRNLSRELDAAEWVRAGLDSNYSIGSGPDGFAAVEVPHRPSNAQVRELLLLMRPFVLQSEATYFPKVSARLRGYMTHPHLQRVTDQLRAHFDATLQQSQFTVVANQLRLNNDDTFTLWLNSFGGYHQRDDRREKFERLHGGPPDEISLAVFRDMLAAKAESVLALASFITQIEEAPSNKSGTQSG